MGIFNSILCNGSARFLNTINGNITSADQVNHTLTVTLKDGTGSVVAYPYDGSDNVSISVSESGHYHGDINSTGAITNTDVTIASGDKLIVMDSSNSNKIAKTSVSFDGSTTTQCLTKKGTWATFGTSNLAIGTTATTAAAGNHTHGNIQNGGTLQTNDITIANGDKLVVTDSSDSSKVARTSISFDGSTATQCLTKKGTWETFASSNTDTKVTQTNITTAATYSIPLCKTYNTTTETDSLYKNLGLSYSLNGNQAGLCISEPGKDDASTLSAAAISNQAIQMMSRASTTATPDILAISSTDISFLTTGTWDGTNISLKTAVTAAKGTVRQEILSNFPSGAEYPIALAYSSSTSAEDNKIYKISNLKYDPSWGNLTLSSSSGVNSKVQLGNSGRVDDSNNTWTTGEVIITDTDSKTLTVESRDIYNSSKWDGTNTSLKTAIKDKVSKSSGTTVDNPISGAIAITDNFFSKVASVDLSKSNNNLSSDYFGLVDFRDKNKKRFGYIQYGVRTSGGTDASLRAVNFPAGGTTEYTNSLTLMTSKAGAYTYSVTNATNFRSAIGAAASSSIKTKENISDLTEEEALKLLKIRPVSFDYKQGFDIDNKYERNYGVIAEETIDIIPSVVNVPTTEGYEFDETKGTNQELITVDYAKFVPYLIKLVQMQQQEIDELKNR